MIATSCVVRARDFREPWFAERTKELGENFALHRKLWEFCSIAQVYHERFGAGGRVLGFGVGLEPMAAWFASRLASVVATDRPDETEAWSKTGQHAGALNQLRRPVICSDADFDEHVRFLPVDMNDIPDGLLRGEFDLTWSAGSFEHVGSIRNSVEFFCRQMRCLRSGGLAVHTTEFNPINYRPTVEAHDLVLFREQELEMFRERIEAQGDELWPLDLAPGTEEADAHVDRPPYGLPHLRIEVCGSFVTTSVLMVAKRGSK